MRRFQVFYLNFLFRFQEVSHKYCLKVGLLEDLQGRLAVVYEPGVARRTPFSILHIRRHWL